MYDCILIWFRANLCKGWTDFLWLRFLDFGLLSTYLKGVWRFEKEEGAVDKSVVHSVMCWMPLFIRGRGGAPPPLTAPQHSSARAPPVRSLSLGLLLCPHSQPLFISLNTVSTECQCMCLWVCESFYHFYSQRVVCSVPFSVLDNRLPPNHLTAPHSARPLLDFRITSRKWVCSTCVKLSCAVFLLSQR